MSETILHSLSDVAETLLIPLSVRALESQRPDALLHDETAVALLRRIGCDPARTLADVAEDTRVAVILRSRHIDRMAHDFMARHADAVVVHIGCGLDARFQRVDNGEVEWYDLDLPEVIALRRELIGDDAPHYHLLADSVLDSAWLDVVSRHRPRPFLFLAEGVFMYLEEAQVKWLLQALMEHFPGAELVFDAFLPFFVWANNRRVKRTGVGALCRWGLRGGQDIERWSDGIHLLDEWYPFMQAEPRLPSARWARHIPLLAKSIGVFHYELGTGPTR